MSDGEILWTGILVGTVIGLWLAYLAWAVARWRERRQFRKRQFGQISANHLAVIQTEHDKGEGGNRG